MIFVRIIIAKTPQKLTVLKLISVFLCFLLLVSTILPNVTATATTDNVGDTKVQIGIEKEFPIKLQEFHSDIYINQ